VSAELTALIDAGEQAPAAAAKAYWKTVHGLARNDAIAMVEIERPLRRKLLGWRVPGGLSASPVEALARIVTDFVDFAKSTGVADAVVARYRERAGQIHDCLPDVLARTEIMPAYGVEPEVARRVFDRLERSYGLSRAVIENTLFRNLLGFITEIAKQPHRWFDRVEFEFVLRSAWPHMLPVRDPPPLGAGHVSRRDLTERFTAQWTGNALEAIGISGSGKTSLAAEAVEHSRRVDPDRRVYYAAVREEITLRDVLVGVGFQLRRLGIPEPFALSVESGLAEEELLARLARAYSALSQQILLLVDLADGGCTDTFARDLASFIRALPPGACRIAVFGQESGLRELTPLQRDECGVGRLDIRGFRFEEFVTLVGYHHPDPDRAALWDIYQRVTAGRSAGLFAKLANSLARAASLAEMSEMAARPPGDILARAEQQRFARLSPAVRNAAEKLLCFALPFRREDAEQIFPDDTIGAAIPELLTQGLLQPLGQDLFEMHETVRAGL
jgi:hypothetical protein